MTEQPLPVLHRRRIQAEVIGPIFAEMVAEVGRETARSILDNAIRKAALAEGHRYRMQLDDDAPVMQSFIELFDLWKADGGLEIDVLAADDARFDFDVTRCQYAEMYTEMGLAEIGGLLSCNRDATFCEGFDPRLELVRDQTIMAGASCCTFRYTLRDAPPSP